MLILAMSTLPAILLRTEHSNLIHRLVLAGALVVVLAGAALTCSIADAAGRDEAGPELRSAEPRSTQRAERVQELRRQLLEHGKRWRGGALIMQPLMPGLSDTSAGAVTQALPMVTPASVSATPPSAAPLAAPDASAFGGDSRLTDRERHLLRQQLRQVPRLQAPRRE